MSNLGKYGHHPDQTIDAEIEIEILQGQLAEAKNGLIRALDYRAVTPEGLAIKSDIRYWLQGLGVKFGEFGYRSEF